MFQTKSAEIFSLIKTCGVNGSDSGKVRAVISSLSDQQVRDALKEVRQIQAKRRLIPSTVAVHLHLPEPREVLPPLCRKSTIDEVLQLMPKGGKDLRDPDNDEIWESVGRVIREATLKGETIPSSGQAQIALKITEYWSHIHEYKEALSAAIALFELENIPRLDRSALAPLKKIVGRTARTSSQHSLQTAVHRLFPVNGS